MTIPKTHAVKAQEIEREWYLVDAAGQTLGRLASRVAQILKGKHKPIYSPHLDTGDFVVVINAAKIQVTGKRREQKIYYHHSGYPGGLKATDLATLLSRHPTRVLEEAVRGMLPKNALGEQMMHKLKVYAGSQHPHQAQQPKEIKLA